jgi:hypothetical protein
MNNKTTTRQYDNNKLVVPRRNYDTFTYLLILAFLSCGFMGILNHEMWRDELQAWMIARDSSSIINLFQNLRYEGHPGLWHLGLYFLSRFTHNPFIMQLFHLIIATTSTYIFVRYSFFTRLQKFLFTFGYFSLYEYCLISRNYALGVLFVFCFCALFPNRHKSYLLLSLSLLFLSNTSVYGLILAISLGSALIFERLIKQYIDIDVKFNQKKWDIATSIFIFVFGIIITIIQIVPPADSGVAVEWNTQFDFGRTASTILNIWEAYIPIPNFFEYQFWNSNIIYEYFSYFRLGNLPIVGLVAVFISLVLFTLAVTLFVRKPVVLCMYLSGTIGIGLFQYLKYSGNLRHDGNLFILLLACLWISCYYEESDILFRFLKVKFNNLYKIIINVANLVSKHRNRLLTVILYTHLLAGAFAFSRDFSHPFSEGKALANFLQSQNMENMLIIGSRNVQVSTLSGYLDRKIYYPEINKFGTFIVWNNKRKEEVTPKELVETVYKIYKQNSQDILLVINYDPSNSRKEYVKTVMSEFLNFSVRIDQLNNFGKSIVGDENYKLYMVKYKAKE